jgi:diphosphomevalonate decarboxylase
VSVAIAHPNIALVKYWGKRDLPLNLPAVPSLSLTLSGFTTRTEVVFDQPHDEVHLDGQPASDRDAARVLAFLDRMVPHRSPVRVVSSNDFPSGAGLASSASGFAALAVAAADAAGQSMTPTELSVWARQGSGSACRSLWGGFVQWHHGERADGLDSHGEPVAPADHWNVRMVVAVVHRGRKAVGSTEGMERSRTTSPYYDAWVRTAAADVAEGIAAVRARDLERLGTVMEQSTYKMHAAMHTSWPPLLYWQPGTVGALHAVTALRSEGVGAWATMDAGPQVKVLCEAADADRVRDALVPHAEQVHVLGPGEAARLC